jgi:hypothetical protein
MRGTKGMEFWEILGERAGEETHFWTGKRKNPGQNDKKYPVYFGPFWPSKAGKHSKIA